MMIMQRMLMMIQCRLPSSPSRHVALKLLSSTLHQHAQTCPHVQGTGIAGAGSRGAGSKAGSTPARQAQAPGPGKGKGPQAKPAPAAGASALAQSLCSPPPRLPTGRQQQGGEGVAACPPACCRHQPESVHSMPALRCWRIPAGLVSSVSSFKRDGQQPALQELSQLQAHSSATAAGGPRHMCDCRPESCHPQPVPANL